MIRTSIAGSCTPLQRSESGHTVIETLTSLALIGAITLSFAALAVRTAQLTKVLPQRAEKTRCTTLSCSSSPEALACACSNTRSTVVR